MPDNRSRLKATLDELHQELEAIEAERGDAERGGAAAGPPEPIDDEVRTRLERAVGEIAHLLEHETPGPPAEEHHGGLTGRLRDLSDHFQETHPQLAANLGGLVDVLSRMGF